MDQNSQQKSMSDAVGATVVVGDSVAYYNAAKGKTIFGKVLKLNSASMIIQPIATSRKNSTVRKNSSQVVKVSIEIKKIIHVDALGTEIKVGDFVAMTSDSINNRHYWTPLSKDYNGKIIFGEIKNLKRTSADVRVVGQNKILKKSPNKIFKVSEEQMTLILFSL
jgi:hypothetical protein